MLLFVKNICVLFTKDNKQTLCQISQSGCWKYYIKRNVMFFI